MTASWRSIFLALPPCSLHISLCIYLCPNSRPTGPPLHTPQNSPENSGSQGAAHALCYVMTADPLHVTSWPLSHDGDLQRPAPPAVCGGQLPPSSSAAFLAIPLCSFSVLSPLPLPSINSLYKYLYPFIYAQYRVRYPLSPPPPPAL